ncbi:glycosyltransferase family 2 protein [Lacrimispora sp. AGF001]|uniref:glycosyltransferase family 2 protein n=1 Tax=Lacrimispora sp. AGF001 TaxID=3401631 RepID=UPI003B42A443
MMNYIFWCLIVVVCMSDMFIVIGLIYMTDKRIFEFTNKLPSSNTNISDQKLYIVIALFNESKSIEETIHYFSKFLCDNIRLILVTTEKERRIFGYNKTLDVINNMMKETSCEYISVVNYPGEIGNKGAQLNYLLSQMKDKLYNPDNYLVIYDCDSRPDKESILELCNLVGKGVNVIQQSTLYTKNFENVSAYMRVEGIFETIRSMGYERFNYFLSCLPLNKIMMPYAYCVGHGMCFKGKFLYDIGGFPEPNEDVPQGMKLMLLKQGIVPMVSKDHGDVVKNVKMLFYQSGNWIKAPLQAFKVLSEINQEKIKKVSHYRKVLFYMSVFFDFLSWIQYLLLLIVSLMLLIGSHVIGTLGVIILVVFPIFQILLCCKTYKIKLTKKMLALSPLRNIFRGMAIFSALYQKLRRSYNEMGR